MFPRADEVVALLDVEQIGADLFRGYSPANAGRQVYGGQAVAQALVATQRTAPDDRPVHSFHAYFILRGDPKTPITYSVERVRDGKSFTTRRCVATQHGQAIFSLEASFQIAEMGMEHALPMPDAPQPESLPPLDARSERFAALPPSVDRSFAEALPVDMRIVPPTTVPSEAAPQQLIWLRFPQRLPDSQATHSAVLAYLSDMTLLETALVVHGRSIHEPDLQVASLDHALWFLRPFRADEWLLYAQDSPAAFGARALTRGLVYSADGRLVASVAQEGLVRERHASRI